MNVHKPLSLSWYKFTCRTKVSFMIDHVMSDECTKKLKDCQGSKYIYVQIQQVCLTIIHITSGESSLKFFRYHGCKSRQENPTK